MIYYNNQQTPFWKHYDVEMHLYFKTILPD